MTDGEPIDRDTMNATMDFFDSLLRLLHPFMPFITEELWQHLADRRDGESIMYAEMPRSCSTDSDPLLQSMERAKEIITAVRGVRASKNLSPREPLSLSVVDDGECALPMRSVVEKLANLSGVTFNAVKDAAAASFIIGTTEFNVPLSDAVDSEAELAKLRKELEYQQGFLASVEKKLSNERFTAKAPQAVVDAERRKQADAQAKIASLQASIDALSGK